MTEEKGQAIPSMRRIPCAIAGSEIQVPTGKDRRKDSKDKEQPPAEHQQGNGTSVL